MPQTFERWTISHKTYDRLHEHDWFKNPHYVLYGGNGVTSFSEILTCARNVAEYCNIRIKVKHRRSNGDVVFICTTPPPPPPPSLPAVEDVLNKTFGSAIWSSARGTAKMAARSFIKALEDEGYEIVRKS